MGQDILRSKSLDRNSYDSGDWFNRVYWDKSSNNFGEGLPPAWDNSSRWDIMAPAAGEHGAGPGRGRHERGGRAPARDPAHPQELPLFRLTSEADVNARVCFYNTDNTQDALIVMRAVRRGRRRPGRQLRDDPGLLQRQQDGAEHHHRRRQRLQPAPGPGRRASTPTRWCRPPRFDDATDTFTIPARTTAVFVSAQALTPPLPPSTLDWVGEMYPRGGVANEVDAGRFAPGGFDVYVQVYEQGVTEAAGEGAGIACYLHWGEYGGTWTDIGHDLAMPAGQQRRVQGHHPAGDAQRAWRPAPTASPPTARRPAKPRSGSRTATTSAASARTTTRAMA